jgi:hypothetical protein
MIDSAFADFLQEGLAIHVGTRNDRLEPNGARASAARVDGDGVHVTVFVPKVAAGRILPDLKSNGATAIVFCRPVDDRTCQVKGTFISARPGRADEQAFVLDQWSRFLVNLEQIGIPRAAAAAWVAWPAIAVRVKATAIFDQTPGPQAGTQLR